MHGVRDQIADALEHGAVPRETGLTGERLRHDHQGKVPATTRRTCVPDMLRTVVMDVDERGGQRSQPCEPSRGASPLPGFPVLFPGAA